jgi:hypothetical protein
MAEYPGREVGGYLRTDDFVSSFRGALQARPHTPRQSGVDDRNWLRVRPCRFVAGYGPQPTTGSSVKFSIFTL